MQELYKKRNETRVSLFYPIHGSKNILRTVSGKKVASGTGPSGKFITVEEDNGQVRSLSVSKCVASL